MTVYVSTFRAFWRESKRQKPQLAFWKRLEVTLRSMKIWLERK